MKLRNEIKFSLMVLVCLLVMVTSPVIAQTGSKSQKDEQAKYSLEASVGSYKFPGLLFELDGSVTRHPAYLRGFMETLHLSRKIRSNWSVGLEFFRAEAAGHGEWARSSIGQDFLSNGVSGVVNGQTKASLTGLDLDFEKRFGHGRFQPYLRTGIGVARFKVDFSGVFKGYETESGDNLPVIEPAEDSVSRRIPVVKFELGGRCNFNRHFYAEGSSYWNTGYGLRFGMGLNF